MTRDQKDRAKKLDATSNERTTIEEKMTVDVTRVKIKKPTKKKSGYEVEQREDGFFYGEEPRRRHAIGRVGRWLRVGRELRCRPTFSSHPLPAIPSVGVSWPLDRSAPDERSSILTLSSRPFPNIIAPAYRSGPVDAQ